MTIYIGSDHRGFALKQKLVPWLQERGHEVVDCGNDHLEPLDDYVDFSKSVATKLQSQLLVTSNQIPQNSFGILLCGSGIGAAIAANRHKGVRCALGFDVEQVHHGRQNDHINCLSIPAEYIDEKNAQEMITVFLESTPKQEEKYLRRVKKLDEM